MCVLSIRGYLCALYYISPRFWTTGWIFPQKENRLVYSHIVTTTLLVDVEPILVFIGLLRDYLYTDISTILSFDINGGDLGFALYLARGLLGPLSRIFHLRYLERHSFILF